MALIWGILCLTRLYACWSFSFSLSSRSRSLSFATMIWAARSSWLRRSEIVLSRAFTSGIAFFAPLSPQPCPHGSSLFVFPSIVFRQCPLFSHLSGAIAGVHLFPSVFIAIVVKAVLPACDVSMGPSGPSLTRFLSWGPVLSWVCFHPMSPVMVVDDPWLSGSPGELWVPA